MRKYLLAVVLIVTSGVAQAGCWYNGYVYPTGTVIGGLTCQSDGTWK